MPYKPRQMPLTQDEAVLLAGACRTLREKRVVWTLLDTGVSVSELTRLTRSQVTPEGCYLGAGSRESAGGTGSSRTIAVTPRVAGLLVSWFSKHESFGLSVRTIQRVVRAVASRAGIERRVCALALRHTFAVAAIMGGMSPVDLQRLLGHKRLASTEAYFLLARGQDGRSARKGSRAAAGPAKTETAT
jgi:integrase/recombinase XerD